MFPTLHNSLLGRDQGERCFPFPAELISSHLQSLVNIRPSLARQSHAQWPSDDDDNK